MLDSTCVTQPPEFRSIGCEHGLRDSLKPMVCVLLRYKLYHSNAIRVHHYWHPLHHFKASGLAGRCASSCCHMWAMHGSNRYHKRIGDGTASELTSTKGWLGSAVRVTLLLPSLHSLLAVMLQISLCVYAYVVFQQGRQARRWAAPCQRLSSVYCKLPVPFRHLDSSLGQ